MKKADKIINSSTDALTSAAQLLGTKQPQRVSIGLVLGLVIDALVEVFAHIRELDLSYLAYYHALALGVLMVYFPLFIRFLNPARKELYDERLDRVFVALRATFKDGDIDPNLRRQFYLKIASQVVDSLNLDEATRKEIMALRDAEQKEQSADKDSTLG